MARVWLPALFSALAAAMLLSASNPALAQDRRTVVEPHIPAACAVLTAAPAGADDTARIQDAIDHCGAGAAVRLAAGDRSAAFVAGPLILRSGVTLWIDAGATLYATSKPSAYDLGQGLCGRNDAAGKGCKPFITVDDTNGAAIMGDGVIDGQGGQAMTGDSQSWWQLARQAQRDHLNQNAPHLIAASRARDFTLYRITLRHAPKFHVVLRQVEGFTAWGVTIDTPADARNTDGIDPISSRDITITRSFIRAGDDDVAIKSGKEGPSQYISVVHNHFYSGHGMSIGSNTDGGIDHVLVDDLSMDGTTSGLRIKSDRSRGGLVGDIRYANVCLRGVRKPIDISAHYDAQAVGALIPRYEGIVFEHVHGMTPGRPGIEGYDDAHPGRVRMDDVTFDGQGGACACAAAFAPFPVAAGKAARERPQLSAQQAQAYSYAEVLKYTGKAGEERLDPWDPLAETTMSSPPPDYIVDAASSSAGVFHSVQAAVSQAVADMADGHPNAGKKRLYILLKPGVYRELLYVPATRIPLTLYGEDGDAGRTRIGASLDAAVAGGDYAARFGAQFAAAPPQIQAMYQSVLKKQLIDTVGTAIVWIRSDGFQARNITFANDYNRDKGGAGSECPAAACPTIVVNGQKQTIHHQAVALMVDGADKVQFENVRFLGYQDTLFLRSAAIAATARSFFDRVYIEGDVDFIFGDTTAYFNRCEIRSLGDRSASYATAANTSIHTRYGFVFNECRFTSDRPAAAGKFYLGRQWFHSQRCTPYAPVAVADYVCAYGSRDYYEAPVGGISKDVLETVGKVAILNSTIGAHIDRRHPWSDWNAPGSLSYRPVQYDSDDYWNNLLAAHLDPQALGYAARREPAEPFLVEFNNRDEGDDVAPRLDANKETQ
jgi:pectin methylesterase-like acyl-CoA thioesterase